MYRWINQDRLPTGFCSQLPVYPWYDATQINDINTSAPRVQLGTAWFDVDYGNAFAYVKAKVALAAGQLVYQDSPTVDTIAAPAGVADNLSILNLTTGGLTVNAEVNNWVNIENAYATTAPQLRRIKANLAGTLTISVRDLNNTTNAADADVSAVAVTTGTNVQIIRPFMVNLNTATTVPVGVALGTVTAGYYTIIQIAGLAMVKALGSTAIVTNKPVVGTAGGVIIGTATPVIYMQGAKINPLVACTETATSGTPIPCYVNFIGAL